MATTAANARKLLSQGVGDWVTDTTSATSGAGTLVCSRLADRADDFYNEQFVMVTSGTALGNVRRISDFTGTTGTVTPYIAFSGSIAASVTFELHRIDPTEKDQSIIEACRDVYPYLRKEIVDKTLVGSNPLPNSHFEDWVADTTKPDYWTTAGTGITIAANTTAENFRGGAKSVALTRAGTNGYLYISESEWPALLDFANYNISVYSWVKSSATAQVRIQVYTKAGTAGTEKTTNGTYHTGGGEWEKLKNENITIPSDLRDIEIRLSSDAANTVCYLDNTYIIGFPTYKYIVPKQFVGWPTEISYQLDTSTSTYGCDDVDEQLPWEKLFSWKKIDDGTNKFVLFPYQIPSGQKIIMKGHGYLSQPTGDTSNIELNQPDVKALVAYAAYLLYDRLASKPSAEDVGRLEKEASKWKRKWEDLKPPAILPMTMVT